MIRLRDRCRPPFALFVSILVSVHIEEWNIRNLQDDKLP